MAVFKSRVVKHFPTSHLKQLGSILLSKKQKLNTILSLEIFDFPNIFFKCDSKHSAIFKSTKWIYSAFLCEPPVESTIPVLCDPAKNCQIVASIFVSEILLSKIFIIFGSLIILILLELVFTMAWNKHSMGRQTMALFFYLNPIKIYLIVLHI